MEKSNKHKRINAPIGSELSTHHTGLCPLLLVGAFMRLKRSGCADSCDFRLERDKTGTLGQEYTTRNFGN
jgi:hypothetical protein